MSELNLETRNKEAAMHSLKKEESIYFKHMIAATKDRLNAILDENQLTGKWAISEDYEWLVKIED